jgi:thioredoxin
MSSNYKGAIHLTKEDFLYKVMDYEQNPDEWIFRGDKPCIIDFYADWCAPCRITSPILEELANEYHGRIHVYKVDTEKEGELAAVFGIESIPAFLFCPVEGNPVMTAGIARTPEETKQMFREQIEKYLLKNKS